MSLKSYKYTKKYKNKVAGQAVGKYQGWQLTARCSCVAQINPQGGLVFSNSAYRGVNYYQLKDRQQAYVTQRLKTGKNVAEKGYGVSGQLFTMAVGGGMRLQVPVGVTRLKEEDLQLWQTCRVFLPS